MGILQSVGPSRFPWSPGFCMYISPGNSSRSMSSTVGSTLFHTMLCWINSYWMRTVYLQKLDCWKNSICSRGSICKCCSKKSFSKQLQCCLPPVHWMSSNCSVQRSQHLWKKVIIHIMSIFFVTVCDRMCQARLPSVDYTLLFMILRQDKQRDILQLLHNYTDCLLKQFANIKS